MENTLWSETEWPNKCINKLGTNITNLKFANDIVMYTMSLDKLLHELQQLRRERCYVLYKCKFYKNVKQEN